MRKVVPARTTAEGTIATVDRYTWAKRRRSGAHAPVHAVNR